MPPLPRLLALALAGLLLPATGCSWPLGAEPGPGWTVPRAREQLDSLIREGVRDLEANPRDVEGPDGPGEIAVTTTAFTPLLEAEPVPGQLPRYRLQPVRYHEVEAVSVDWWLGGLLITPLTAGLVGPFHLFVDVELATGRILHPNEGLDWTENLWKNLFPLWLIGYRLWGDRTTWPYARALETLRRRAAEGAPTPSEGGGT